MYRLCLIYHVSRTTSPVKPAPNCQPWKRTENPGHWGRWGKARGSLACRAVEWMHPFNSYACCPIAATALGKCNGARRTEASHRFDYTYLNVRRLDGGCSPVATSKILLRATSHSVSCGSDRQVNIATTTCGNSAASDFASQSSAEEEAVRQPGNQRPTGHVVSRILRVIRTYLACLHCPPCPQLSCNTTWLHALRLLSLPSLHP
ncbi:hypothetical protein F5Y18DRAFT_363359 [Xylariaceae sp. FL1019]|nr:hypothetical protein F5Y18DRAFT_363359 [Xylariaceae sp. FL1019]